MNADSMVMKRGMRDIGIRLGHVTIKATVVSLTNPLIMGNAAGLVLMAVQANRSVIVDCAPLEGLDDVDHGRSHRRAPVIVCSTRWRAAVPRVRRSACRRFLRSIDSRHGNR